jgi:O-antigen/teichoic acid export membrane protein
VADRSDTRVAEDVLRHIRQGVVRYGPCRGSNAYAIVVALQRAVTSLGALTLLRGSTWEFIGYLTMFWTVGAILGPLLSAGFDWRLTLDSVDGDPGRSLRGVLRLRFGLGALVCAAAYTCGWIYLTPILALYGLLTLAAVTFDAARSGLVAILLGSGDSKTAARNLGYGLSLRIAGTFASVFLPTLTSRTILLGSTQCLGSILELILMWRRWDGRAESRGAGLNLWTLLRRDWRLSAVALISQAYARCDAVLVSVLLPVAQLGQWGLWSRFAEPYLLLLGVAQPLLLRRSRKRCKLYPARRVAACTLLAAAPVPLMAPLFVSVITGKEVEGLGFLLLLPAFLAAASCSVIWQVQIIADDQVRGMPWAIFGILVANVLLDVLLIPIVGNVGAALAASLSESLVASYFYAHLRSYESHDQNLQ